MWTRRLRTAQYMGLQPYTLVSFRSGAPPTEINSRQMSSLVEAAKQSGVEPWRVRARTAAPWSRAQRADATMPQRHAL